MRIVVLGSTGMAGHMISHYLEEAGHEVFCISRSEKNGPNSQAIDVTNFAALSKYLDEVSPQAVVNCVGLLQKACEQRPDLAVLINTYLPHYLEQHFAQRETKVIHLSTDCVFSGEQGGYTEDMLPDGRTMNDRSKALGEIINGKDLTFRMSIIGPDPDPKGTGLLNWFMEQTGEIQGYSKCIWNGVTTLELAKAINQALRESISGLYHLVLSKPINKYDLLCLFHEFFPRKGLDINKIDGLVQDKSLINTRIDFGFEVSPYRQQISELKEWVTAHKVFYPHYHMFYN